MPSFSLGIVRGVFKVGGMIRIGIVGCGRILAAHLEGYRILREAGVDGFAITALCARRADDALGYVKRGEGPPQRRAVSAIPGDPLAVGDQYLSDFQPGTRVEVFTDYREMIASGRVDAVTDGRRIVRVHNGHEMMRTVTGVGCVAAALIAAFCSVGTDHVASTVAALSYLGLAAEKAATESGGPGSFQIRLLDALYGLQEDDLMEGAQVEIASAETRWGER